METNKAQAATIDLPQPKVKALQPNNGQTGAFHQKNPQRSKLVAENIQKQSAQLGGEVVMQQAKGAFKKNRSNRLQIIGSPSDQVIMDNAQLMVKSTLMMYQQQKRLQEKRPTEKPTMSPPRNGLPPSADRTLSPGGVRMHNQTISSNFNGFVDQSLSLQDPSSSLVFANSVKKRPSVYLMKNGKMKEFQLEVQKRLQKSQGKGPIEKKSRFLARRALQQNNFNNQQAEKAGTIDQRINGLLGWMNDSKMGSYIKAENSVEKSRGKSQGTAAELQAQAKYLDLKPIKLTLQLKNKLDHFPDQGISTRLSPAGGACDSLFETQALKPRLQPPGALPSKKDSIPFQRISAQDSNTANFQNE